MMSLKWIHGESHGIPYFRTNPFQKTKQHQRGVTLLDPTIIKAIICQLGWTMSQSENYLRVGNCDP